jgi:TetR/AcrR family transcriptional regulator, cholesterol catabolism regulator
MVAHFFINIQSCLLYLGGSRQMSSNKQKEIALAAVKLFEQKGYRATSVQDIADEVGLQKGSLYHYIHSKEDLLLQIAHQAISEFNQRLEKIIDMDAPAKEKLIRMIENHITVSVSNMQTTTVLLREAFSLGENPHQLVQEQTDRYLALLTAILDEGVANGEFSIENPKIAALGVLGACNWVYRWYKSSGELDATEISRIFSNLFLDGLIV